MRRLGLGSFPLILGFLVSLSGCGGPPPPPDRVKLYSGKILEGRVQTRKLKITSKVGVMKRILTQPTSGMKKLTFPSPGKVKAVLISKKWKKDKKGKRIGDKKVHSVERGDCPIYKIEFKTTDGKEMKISTGDITWVKFGRGYPKKPEEEAAKK